MAKHKLISRASQLDSQDDENILEPGRMRANDKKKYLTFYFVAFITAMAAACSPKLQKFNVETPAQILSTVESPAVMDGRTRFRQIFCALLEDPITANLSFMIKSYPVQHF